LWHVAVRDERTAADIALPAAAVCERSRVVPNEFLPATDGALVDWSRNFGQIISADPHTLGLSEVDAQTYQSLHQQLAAAVLACAPQIRTMGLTAHKNAVRAELKALARRLVKLINGQADVSDQQRIELGLSVRSRPKRATVPDEAPILKIRAVQGNRATVSLSSETHRAKPPGVIGATLFRFVGDQPPASMDAWQFAGNFGRSTITCIFPTSVPGGALVWLRACWLNSRLQNGPFSAIQSAHLQGAVIDTAGRLAA